LREKRDTGRRPPLRRAAPVAFLAVALGACGGPAANTTPRASERLPAAVVRGERPGEPVRTQLRNASPPRRISIPAIGVSAPVIPLHLNPDRTLEVPRDYAQTGWFTGGPEPGERGPSVIVGHVDSKTGPAVFYRLRELRRGQIIKIGRIDGTTVRFRVDGLERWPKSEFPTSRVYGRTRGATLRLVTCSGNFDPASGHYEDNTIVFATRV
jgi:hypothetical protein